MGFSGNWLARQFSTTPLEGLHQADSRHMRYEQADSTQGAFAAPPILADDPAPYVYERIDWVVNDADGYDGPAGVIDYTPVDHSLGDVIADVPEQFTTADTFSPPADVALQRAQGYAHGTDYGSVAFSTYAEPPFQASDERYLSPRFESFGPEVGDALPALVGGGMRGINGYSVNNPPLEMYGGRGFRYGWVEQAWVDRKMYDPQRVHDERLETPNVADVATDQPVPFNAGAYNEPWPSLSRIITEVRQQPILRRTPPPIDQSIIGDGSDQGYQGGDDWVAG